MTDEHGTTYEPHHGASPTDHVLQELALYGYRPFQGEPDPRPLPEGNIVAGSIADIFDALVVALGIDDKDLVSSGRELAGEQDRGHGLSRPTFGRGDRDL